MFLYPTIRSFALRDPSAAVAPVIALTAAAEPGLPTLFLFPPAAGTGLAYIGLRNRLRHPAYALTNPDFGRPWRYTNYQELAAAYVAEIEARSSGPYILGGYSVGGHVALIVAAQLLARGREVRQLLLLDSMCMSVAEAEEIEGAQDQRALLLADHVQADSALAAAVALELEQTYQFGRHLQPPLHPPRLALPILLLRCTELSLEHLAPRVHALVQALHHRPTAGFDLPLTVHPLHCTHAGVFAPQQLEATISLLASLLAN